MNKNRYQRYLVMVFCFACLLILTGCNDYTIDKIDNVYNKFSLTKGICQFSMDYNQNYRIKNIENKNTYIDLFFESPYDNENHSPPFINISYDLNNVKISNYIDAINKVIINYKYYPEFKIIERKNVSVAGEEGETITFRFLWKPPLQYEKRIKPKYVVYWQTVFVYNSLGFNICLNGDEPIPEAAINDYQRLLQTFQFLD
jgi:hypothetical protein